MAITPKGKATNSMPSWVTAPAPGSMNTMATQQLTNPVTGETWTASSGGYSVKPTWDGDSFSQHSGKSYTVDPNNPNNYIGTFRNDYALQPGDNGYIGTGRDLLPPEPGTPGASGVWGNSTSGAQGTGGKGVGNVVNAQPTNSVEPVWADNFNWNTATLADAHRKLSTDKYGMVNYAHYSDADAQRLLDSERSSMASTQQPAPQATGGMGAINPSVFPAIANGMFGNANTGGTAASSFGWQNAQPSQGTGGKGVGNVVNAQPIQSAASLLQPYYNAQQAPTLMSATSGNRAGQPYVYGDLGLTSSDYSLWGSRGNPYLVAGPTYTPGSGLPINPHPLTPIAPPSNGGSDSDYVPPTTGGSDNGGFWGEDSQGWGDLTTSDKALLGPISLYGDFAYGRMDVPGGGYARLPWYEGSAGNGYGYTKEGYDQFAPGDSDRGIYDASTGERAWDDSFDDYNTGDLWAETGVFEGIGNIFGGRTWDGAEGPTIFGQEAPVASTPRTFGNTNSVEAVESRANIANEKARVANNIAAIAAEEARAARVTPSNPYGFAPNDVVTGDTGTWTNPAAGVDTSTLGGSLGTGAGTTYTANDSGTGGTVSVPHSSGSGSVDYSTTDYGNGYHGVDVSSDGTGPDSNVGYEDPNGGGSDSSGGGKVICTAMNADYGFGSFRNAIWLKYAALNYSDKPEMEAGYHALCLPMLRIRKKWYGKPTYAWLKHVAKHRTADLKAEMYGKKRDRIGQAWRFILEPLCYYVGKNLHKGDK